MRSIRSSDSPPPLGGESEGVVEGRPLVRPTSMGS